MCFVLVVIFVLFLRGGILFQKIPVVHEVNCNESRSMAAVTLTNERLDIKASMCS